MAAVEANENDSVTRATSPPQPRSPPSEPHLDFSSFDNKEDALAAAAAYIFEKQPLPIVRGSKGEPSLVDSRSSVASLPRSSNLVPSAIAAFSGERSSHLAAAKGDELPAQSDFSVKRVASAALCELFGPATATSVSVTLNSAQRALAEYFASQRAGHHWMSPINHNHSIRRLIATEVYKALMIEIVAGAQQFKTRPFDVVANKKMELVAAAKLLFFGMEVTYTLPDVTRSVTQSFILYDSNIREYSLRAGSSLRTTSCCHLINMRSS